VNDNLGFVRGPQENLYSVGVEAQSPPAAQMRTAEQHVTVRQAVENTLGFSFRLKPDRRCGAQPYATCDRRQRR
jgi:hypothetical protein